MLPCTPSIDFSIEFRHESPTCRMNFVLDRIDIRYLIRPYDFCVLSFCSFFFFFNDTATTEIYTLSLHDALPISDRLPSRRDPRRRDAALTRPARGRLRLLCADGPARAARADSVRLVFALQTHMRRRRTGPTGACDRGSAGPFPSRGDGDRAPSRSPVTTGQRTRAAWPGDPLSRVPVGLVAQSFAGGSLPASTTARFTSTCASTARPSRKNTERDRIAMR